MTKREAVLTVSALMIDNLKSNINSSPFVRVFRAP
jgi:hypothetical protein